jgi:hypothetical protein
MRSWGITVSTIGAQVLKSNGKVVKNSSKPQKLPVAHFAGTNLLTFLMRQYEKERVFVEVRRRTRPSMVCAFQQSLLTAVHS